MVTGMGRVFRGDRPVPPASASPPGGVPGGHEPVRARLPAVRVGGFRRGVPAVRGQQPWGVLGPPALHGVPSPSARRSSCLPPSPRRRRSGGGGSGHPAVRQPPAGRPTPPIGSGPRGGLCRDYNARSCTRAACRYEHRCTRCGGPHPAVSCPPP